MKIERGDIVLVDFPYSDQTGSKVRPALVVQDDRWNAILDDTILAVITSSLRRNVGAPTQLQIRMGTIESAGSGLLFDSLVDCQTLLTYDKTLILARLGRLSSGVMMRIDECLKQSLGI
ncbi:MAG: type II toxin-antitoxin system PemK/MazF family toxin [Planctomycetaceae bacterium]|nr:type II toxin-antitoxin system PemK/MazF family toxin [Planctomycetaceae bacterium]